MVADSIVVPGLVTMVRFVIAVGEVHSARADRDERDNAATRRK